MGNPTLLLLDEPSGGLAPVVVSRLADALIALKNQGVSMVVSEQNQRLARRVSERVILIDTGSPAFTGSFDDLDKEPAIALRHLGVLPTKNSVSNLIFLYNMYNILEI